MLIEYWCRSNDSADVIEFLEEIRSNDPELHDRIWTIIEEFEQYGMELGRNRKTMISPPLRPYKNLYELRPYGYRIFFTFRNSKTTAYLLLMCKKASQKASPRILKIAYNRSKSIK